MTKEIVMEFMSQFFKGNSILKYDANHTFLTLIPKASTPIEMGDFMLIIMSTLSINSTKILAGKIGKVSSELISS